MVKKNLGIDGPIYVAPDVNVYAEKPKEPETNTGIMGLVRAIGRDLIGADPDKYMYSEGLSLAPIKKDIETGKIQPSFPGIARSIAQEVKRVAPLPGKAIRGETVTPQEGTDFALTFTGASILAPKPKGVVATMGIGKGPQVQKTKPEKTRFGTYSKLEENILNLPQDKYQAKDVLSKLKKSEGVKEDELKWTGIEDLLKGKDKVTKQELIDHIQDNRVNIAEMPLGVVDRSLKERGTFTVERVPTIAERDIIKQLKSDRPGTFNRANSNERELFNIQRRQLYSGSVIGERSEKGLVNTIDEIEKSVDELFEPLALKDTEGKVQNPISKTQVSGMFRNNNSIKKDTYWAIGSPVHGYKIMRNNELAFDAYKGVTSDAFKKDFDRVFGEKIASDGFPLIEVSRLNNKYLKLDEPKMQTVINNLNGKANIVGQVKYPRYTLPPHKIEAETESGIKYMKSTMVTDPVVNYREIPVGFDDASKKRIVQKQRELGEGFGALDTEGTEGYSRAHYGMGEIGFYNVQDRNLKGFGKTLSVEHLQSDYGAAKGKQRQLKKQEIAEYGIDRLKKGTDFLYTEDQLKKLGLNRKEILRYLDPGGEEDFLALPSPFDYIMQSLDKNHFYKMLPPDTEAKIIPLDTVLKALTPEQRKAYDDAVKSIDDQVNQIDFGSAKKGKSLDPNVSKPSTDEGYATGLIPSAPLVTNEPDVIKLIIRTALQRAAREDYDAISFPTSDLIKTIPAIDPGQKGVTVYDRLLPKEINKIMKKIGGKKYDDDNYFTKKVFYGSRILDPDYPIGGIPADRSSPMNQSEIAVPPNNNFLRVIPLSKEIKKKLLEQGAETFKEGGSIIASNPYGNYEPRAI